MDQAKALRHENWIRAKSLYENSIRRQVETEENIGKMVIVDIDSEDFEIEAADMSASQRLRKRNNEPKLFGIRIGFNFAESFGGVIERTKL